MDEVVSGGNGRALPIDCLPVPIMDGFADAVLGPRWRVLGSREMLEPMLVERLPGNAGLLAGDRRCSLVWPANRTIPTPSPIRTQANMRSDALPELLCTVDASTSSARSMLCVAISQLADDNVRLLDDVLDTSGKGSAVGPIDRSCECGTSDVRCLTALSAGATAPPGGYSQGRSFFRKSSSLRHGGTACACNVGAGVGRGIQDAETPLLCCGVTAAAPLMTARRAGVVGP